jgi:hypothetical protein
LLSELLEKDFSASIRSGFQATGLVPLNAEKPLSKLPTGPDPDDAAVETDVQRQLLQKLSDMRHRPPPTTRAPRPKKADKLPPGTAYTSSSRPGPSGDTSSESSNSSSESEESESSSDSEEERRQRVQDIIKRLRKKKQEFMKKAEVGIVETDEEEQPEEAEPEEEEPEEEEEPVEKELDPDENTTQDYPAGAYVVAVYQENWYVGQVLQSVSAKEPYVRLTFMERTSGNCMKWPSRPDILSTLKVKYHMITGNFMVPVPVRYRTVPYLY